MWHIWLILSGIFLIIEIITVGFLIFWLSIGALFAMITSFFTDSVLIQTSVFVISSTILIFATKPFVKKFAKNGLVIKEIDSVQATGQIKVEGEIWSAVCKDNTIIPKDSIVKVQEIKGVKAIVTPI